MMKGFYDSLETLQKVQFATKRDYIYLGLWVVVAVVVFWAFFIGVDTIWSGLYKTFYTTMRWADYSLEQSLTQSGTLDTATSWSLLDTVDLSSGDVQVVTDSDSSTGVEVSVQ